MPNTTTLLASLALAANFLATNANPDFNNCRISDADAQGSPWLGSLSISLENEDAIYWPVVIIGPTTLLTAVQALRPQYDCTLNIRNYSKYIVHLQDGVPRRVASVQLNPGVEFRSGQVCANWMHKFNDFALIHLQDTITFLRVVRPLCIPSWGDEWWERKQDAGTSFLPPETINIISGWKGMHINAMVPRNVGFFIRVNNSNECNHSWKRCAEYAEFDGETPPYVDRICGTPVRTDDLALQGRGFPDVDLEEDHGLFAGHRFFNIHANLSSNESEYVLNGIVGGIAHGPSASPTAYILLMKPAIIRWINASLLCKPTQYTCHSGNQCIDPEQLCDRIPNCADSSDEDGVQCRARRPCTFKQYPCGFVGECLDNLKEDVECNGTWDCENGEDEDIAICQPLAPTWRHLIIWVTVTAVAAVAGIAAAIVGYYRLRKARAKTRLTEEEVRQFRQGDAPDAGEKKTSVVGPTGSPGSESAQLTSANFPFIYEVDSHEIELDTQIGEGAFGVVHRGTLRRDSDSRLVVAVKEPNPHTVTKEMFKACLSELKIIAFVTFIKGGHPNIVQLIGACTAQIRKFQVLIVLEYCVNGSISDFLVKNRTEFRKGACQPPCGPDYVPRVETCPPRYIPASSLQRGQALSLQILQNWSLQIADGMEFLSTHKIVHGDLAARNVLLDSALNAKISDFGLSIQVYYSNLSSTHVSNHEMLPWRWLAPEVIETMAVSSKSDVWSFGVTLWEIDTLGNLPFGGLNWSPYFVEQVKGGLRLPRPQHASLELFKIMESCWTLAVNDRPDFTILKNMLQNSK